LQATIYSLNVESLVDVLPPVIAILIGGWLILDRDRHARRAVRSQNRWRRRVGLRLYGAREQRHNIRAAVIVGAWGIALGLWMLASGADF
jgi:purine-cytosine permease-like protein